ncbi:MAG: hypothetical protein A2651_00655 [Candidatus Yanofskybacteria bacterium RIFCSPHIGHO2_01_FULL_42_12]|uniref:O-antigen ligase-related domain-containing protein n=1 Tax=Candidatus Yanofskybacteria bacterium RIFCSPLOWO2_01_FULL_42_49 TaxID=1802694 RepID=A0A1F8GAC3_9BACT|nr:MAG: hypothetical protein A2651_00655 [Candidatus Yanofskybacteria bacterium RIFCSPHIGHO2_01_FULL_42_12]OGN22241.1 MAG: hypothetical protein A2918_02540 [Candidatus Yanofskybacteria bacterium RIFCSPLOWO2_01_FULL_42_49]
MIAKLEQFLFYFLFFVIPFQTRKILYSPGWYYNEWQSVSIYATDILPIVLFLFWGFSAVRSSKFSIFPFDSKFRALNLLKGNFQFSNKLQIQNSKKFLNFLISQFLKPDFFLVLFLAAALISVKNSSDFYSGLFLWLQLVEFALFYFYLKTYAIKKFDFIKILCALILGGVFQAVIAAGQFLKQGDLGLRWLGESVLGSHMTGIASFYTFVGDKVIRAYGTTSHPNILAAYLLLAIFAFYFLILYRNKPHYLHSHIMIYGNVGYVLLLFGLFFTFSRTIIFLWVAGFLTIVVASIWAGSKTPVDKRLRKSFIHRLVSLFLVTFVVIGVFSLLYWPEVQSRMTLSSEEEAVRLRIFYNEESLKGGINLFGIGLGDFTGWLTEQNPNLPRHVYQPVHNIYLLIYSEIGIIGFVLFLLFLTGLFYEFIKKTRLCELKHYSFLLVVASVLFIGLFDHFLLTLQQGRFVLWIGLTLLAIGDIIQTGGYHGKEKGTGDQV